MNMSKRLIKNGDIILDGTLPRYAKEKQAFEKLEYIEEVLEKHNIPYEMLDKVLEAVVVLRSNNATPLFPKEVKIK